MSCNHGYDKGHQPSALAAVRGDGPCLSCFLARKFPATISRCRKRNLGPPHGQNMAAASFARTVPCWIKRCPANLEPAYPARDCDPPASHVPRPISGPCRMASWNCLHVNSPGAVIALSARDLLEWVFGIYLGAGWDSIPRPTSNPSSLHGTACRIGQSQSV